MRATARVCLVTGLCLSFGGLARAQTRPIDVPPVSDAPPGMESVQRGVQGPAGLFHSRVLLHINTDKDRVTEPVSLAPDFYYSVTDTFQLGLLHNGPMGLLTRPGAGLCLTGEGDGGCPKVYNNVGFDALFGLAFGNLHASAHTSLYFFQISQPTHAMVTLGLALKLHFSDSVALFLDPQVGLALNHRDDAVLPQEDRLFLPAELQFQINDALAFKILSGVTGVLSELGDTYVIPVGAAFVVNISPALDIGLRYSFDNMLGKRPDGVSATDSSSLAVLLQIRF
jgi:hypothetical protein